MSDKDENTTQTKRAPRQTRIVLTVAVVIAAVALVAALLFWNRSRSGAGRPVPAPRTIAESSVSPAQTEPAESTITLSAEAAQNARIKIETVGEKAIGADATGAPVTG